MEVISSSLEQTAALGQKLGASLKPGMVITLSGDLGAGKTTFTQAIAKGLGITRVVSSPTFTILKQYQGRLELNHFDAYRLEGQDLDLGFEELIDSDAVSIIEWANYMEELLPVDRLEITITRVNDTSRKFSFHPIGNEYEKLIEVIS